MQTSDHIFVKTKSNALTSEAFTAFIAGNSITEFYIVGADATGCVKSTCRVIKQRNITYPQLLNTGNQYSEAYGILALPYAIIFAPDGKIIARDIRGDDIDKKLAEIFGE